MKIKGGFTGKRSVQGKNLIGQYTMWWLNSWMITIGSSWIVNDQSKSCPSANEMQRIAMARQALLVQQCKEAQIEAGPGVRVKCEVSPLKNPEIQDCWKFQLGTSLMVPLQSIKMGCSGSHLEIYSNTFNLHKITFFSVET